MKLGCYFESLELKKRQVLIKTLSVASGKTQSTIRSYINGNRNIPAQCAKDIAKATNNLVTVEELRPDVFGAANTDQSAGAA
jgi:DNA-binding transcriptional regulator YdaS (Cro superfamily)